MSRTTETYEGFRKSEAWASLVLQGTLWSRVGRGTKRNSKRAGKSLGPGSWGTWEKEKGREACGRDFEFTVVVG